MSKTIKLRKGFDINLIGKADNKIAEVSQPETFALKPEDYKGLQRPKLLINEGDTVKAGTPIFHDKNNDQIMYCSPVSGKITGIKRGEKRVIQEIQILADKEISYEKFEKFSVSELKNQSREQLQSQMLKSGAWVNIIQRPYGVIANQDETPKSIFVSGFDSHPLAPDYGIIFKGQENYLQAGFNVLKKFTDGFVHFNLRGNAEIPSVFSQIKNVELNKVAGKHPAGNIGVQIHHIDPINKGDVVWTLNPWGVILIGKLFLEGKYDTSKIVALAGSEVSNPQYYKTYAGASIHPLIENNINSDNVRYISGNVLTGNKIESKGYMGYYDHLITVIPEGDKHEFLGWILPTIKKLSFHRAFGLLAKTSKEFNVTTNTNGEPRAFVQTGTFEKVTPMDIYPTHLLKAIIAEDFDDMEGLGIYEVIEEDLALCEFIDVSKHDIQSIVREGLDLIQYS
ncbi:MAG: Na(+)-translocating NADH-quinone reductase subunit A [Cyclobacteriaceae bacterium]|nr:Na(+)-translocating NADH-quinone reductase subunit A [Cyclobacteriaceae bacterium]